MDSELLNVFNDDYESSLKFEENYWSHVDHDDAFTHLSSNLNGILPITPLEEKMAYFNNDLQVDVFNSIDLNNCFQGEGSSESSFSGENNIYSENDPQIEIVAVNPNEEFDYSSDENDDENNYESEIDDQKSVLTFRTRTDSSSIGDYESHTSDESDFEDDNPHQFQSILSENSNDCIKENTLISHIDCIGDSIMVATSNSNESIKIDTKHFDLAQFITDDNFLIEKLSNINTNDLKNISSNNSESEEEEIDIDIETVEVIEEENIPNEEEISNKVHEKEFINAKMHDKNENISKKEEADNIAKDPSWIPSTIKSNKAKQEKHEKLAQKVIEDKVKKQSPKTTKSANNTTSVRKKIEKQLNASGKNLSMYQQVKRDNSKTMASKTEKPCPLKEVEKPADDKNTTEKSKQEKQEIQPITENDKMERNQENLNITQKKKLNLEEYYKKRKADSSLITNSISNQISNNLKKSPVKNNLNQITPTKQNIHNDLTNIQKPQPLKNPSSLLLPLSFNKSQQRLDPITEARNKVLRMQELKKKAAQKRLIDIVSSKVGPVTKILPLEEIVKNNSKNFKQNENLNSNNQNKSEYEEIIIVSVSCNTDIMIPPKFDKVSIKKDTSTSLLYNISNTIEKATTKENLKISNNSLITSIKTVVLQKTAQDVKQPLPQPPKNESNTSTETANKVEINEHGEDKIIMHLPRNRVKQKTSDSSTQTEVLPEFPLLDLIMPRKTSSLKEYENGHNRGRHKNRKYRSKRDYSNTSSDEEEYDDSEYNKRHRKHDIKSKSSNCGNQTETIPLNDNCDVFNFSDSKINQSNSTNSSISSTEKDYDRSRRKSRRRNNDYVKKRNFSGSCHSTSSSYRSRSSSCSSSNSRSRSRSKSIDRCSSSRYKNYRRSDQSNGRSNSPVEERRIVYVGRIEQDTTKEDLKKKFGVYGPIRQITLHYKDTGMKYGFVTFEKAQDAYKTIDNGSTDTNINMYDISFGGRRAFCRQSYADLDGAATNTFQLYPYGVIPSVRSSLITKPAAEEDSFEALLNKMKQKLSASKANSNNQKT